MEACSQYQTMARKSELISRENHEPRVVVARARLISLIHIEREILLACTYHASFSNVYKSLLQEIEFINIIDCYWYIL